MPSVVVLRTYTSCRKISFPYIGFLKPTVIYRIPKSNQSRLSRIIPCLYVSVLLHLWSLDSWNCTRIHVLSAVRGTARTTECPFRGLQKADNPVTASSLCSRTNVNSIDMIRFCSMRWWAPLIDCPLPQMTKPERTKLVYFPAPLPRIIINPKRAQLVGPMSSKIVRKVVCPTLPSHAFLNLSPTSVPYIFFYEVLLAHSHPEPKEFRYWSKRVKELTSSKKNGRFSRCSPSR